MVNLQERRASDFRWDVRHIYLRLQRRLAHSFSSHSLCVSISVSAKYTLSNTRWNRGLSAFAKVNWLHTITTSYTQAGYRLWPNYSKLLPTCFLTVIYRQAVVSTTVTNMFCIEWQSYIIQVIEWSFKWLSDRVTSLKSQQQGQKRYGKWTNEKMSTKTQVRQLMNLALLQIWQLHLWGDKWLWRGIQSYQLSASYWLDTAIHQFSRYNMKSQERDVSSLLYSDVPILPARYKFSRI